MYYVDPVNKVLKGEIPWSQELRPEAKNFKTFFVHTVSLSPWALPCRALRPLCFHPERPNAVAQRGRWSGGSWSPLPHAPGIPAFTAQLRVGSGDTHACSQSRGDLTPRELQVLTCTLTLRTNMEGKRPPALGLPGGACGRGSRHLLRFLTTGWVPVVLGPLGEESACLSLQPNRTYYLMDPSGNAHKWCRKIQEVWRHRYQSHPDAAVQ